MDNDILGVCAILEYGNPLSGMDIATTTKRTVSPNNGFDIAKNPDQV